MAVIDLGIENPNDQQVGPIEAPKTFINLETGKREIKEPEVSTDSFLLEGKPAQELLGFTAEEAAELPEVSYLTQKLGWSGEYAATFKLAVGSLISSDDAQQIEIIQNALPSAKINTFDSGETVVDYDGEQFVLNRPGLSATDVTRFASQLVAYLPASRMGLVVKEAMAKFSTKKILEPIVKSAGRQRMAQVAAAASANAITSIGMDVGASIMAGDEGTQGVSTGRAVSAAAFGAGGEVMGPAYRAIVRKFRGTPDDLKYIDLDSVRQIKEAEKQTGIRIFEPQATEARSDALYMRVLQDLPETQRQMMSVLNEQNEQASGAVANFLVDIADSSSIQTAPSQIRNMAVNAIDDMKSARSNMVRQGYEEAFSSGTMVDISEEVGLIDAMLSKTSSSASNPVRVELLAAKSQLLSDATDGLVDLQILHSVKMNMDDSIKNFGDSGPTGQSKKALTEIKNSMVEKMDSASPIYDEVKSIYRNASGPINDLENSLIGKIAGIKDGNTKSVLTSLFDPSQSNPAVLSHARDVIQAQSPEAWNGIVRAQIEKQMGKISTMAIEGTPNTPRQLLGAVFGKNEISHKMMMDSLTPEQKGNAKWLEMALKAASRGRGLGSDTAGKTEAIKALKGSVESFSEYFNPLSWSGKLTGAMTNAKFERRAEAFASALTDGQWSSEMLKLKQMNPTDSKSARAFIQLLGRIEAAGVDSEPKAQQPSERIRVIQ